MSLPSRSRRTFMALAAWASGTIVAFTARRGQAQQPKAGPDIRFVVFHKPGPAWIAGKSLFEQPGVRDHAGHYRKWLEAGKLQLGGPHPDAAGGGMMIPVAGLTLEEVTKFANEDPTVKSGLIVAEVRPWIIGMSKA